MTADYAPDSSRAWQRGDRVTLRGREWTVVRLRAYPDCETLRVEGGRGSQSRTFLLPFDRPRRGEEARPTVVSMRTWLRGLEQVMRDACPFGGLQDCSDAIDLVAYQLEPALAMLRHGHTRILIADAVGMGKTIEAGVILGELAARRDAFRALILVPAGLRQQWADELSGRFSLATVGADGAWLQDISRTLPPDVNPWLPPGIYVASFDFVKRPEALRPLEEVRWDLLVVDEVHGATSGTDRRAAIAAIAARALRVLLLTATPPADPSEFAALCSIGQEPGSGDVVMFRRRPVDPRRHVRRSLVLAARITDEERRMHRLLERYTTLIWREAESRGHAAGHLASIVLRKRALSSAGSLEASLRRRQELLAGRAPAEEVQLLLPLVDGDERDDLVPDAVLRAPGLSNLSSEQRWMSAVIDAASAAAGREAKARVLLTLLRRIREPAIVFTEYRDTLEQLRGVLLNANVPVCALHGGLSAAERRHALERFARGDEVLIATDTAAEGLNLQRACRIIVHYELPWNPSRMLQRAGRVDRIGQRRRVHEIALVASHTAESLVLAPLARRAAGWRAAGAEARLLELLTESRIARAIFEKTAPELPEEAQEPLPVAAIDLREEAELEVQRLMRRRRMIDLPPEGGSHDNFSQHDHFAQHDTFEQHFGHRVASAFRRKAVTAPETGILVSTLTRSALPPGLVLLFDLHLSTPHGDILERSPAAIHVALAMETWPWRPLHLKRQLAGLLPPVLAAVAPTVDELARRRLESVQPLFEGADARVRSRARAIVEARESAARQLVQISLFDRRAVRRADQERSACDLLDAEERTAASGARPLTAAASLRAVLVISRRS